MSPSAHAVYSQPKTIFQKNPLKPLLVGVQEEAGILHRLYTCAPLTSRFNAKTSPVLLISHMHVSSKQSRVRVNDTIWCLP